MVPPLTLECVNRFGSAPEGSSDSVSSAQWRATKSGPSFLVCFFSEDACDPVQANLLNICNCLSHVEHYILIQLCICV